MKLKLTKKQEAELQRIMDAVKNKDSVEVPNYIESCDTFYRWIMGADL